MGNDKIHSVQEWKEAAEKLPPQARELARIGVKNRERKERDPKALSVVGSDGAQVVAILPEPTSNEVVRPRRDVALLWFVAQYVYDPKRPELEPVVAFKGALCGPGRERQTVLAFEDAHGFESKLEAQHVAQCLGGSWFAGRGTEFNDIDVNWGRLTSTDPLGTSRGLI